MSWYRNESPCIETLLLVRNFTHKLHPRLAVTEDPNYENCLNMKGPRRRGRSIFLLFVRTQSLASYVSINELLPITSS